MKKISKSLSKKIIMMVVAGGMLSINGGVWANDHTIDGKTEIISSNTSYGTLTLNNSGTVNLNGGILGVDTALAGTKGIINMSNGTETQVKSITNTDLTINGGSLKYSTDAAVNADNNLTLNGVTLSQSLTVNGSLNVTNSHLSGLNCSGNSLINITGQAPTVSGGTKTYQSTINGDVAVTSSGNLSLTNTKVAGTVSVNGGTLNFDSGDNMIAPDVKHSDDVVYALKVCDGGSVRSSEVNILTISSVVYEAPQAIGLKVWESAGSPQTTVNLQGVAGISASAAEVKGLDVENNSQVTLVGTGDATISATSWDGKAIALYMDQNNATVTLDRFSTIIATSDGNAYGVEVLGGTATLRNVGEIKAASKSSSGSVYGVYVANGGLVTLDNVDKITVRALDGAYGIYANDGGTVKLKNIAITGAVEEARTDENKTYGTINFDGRVTVDGNVDLHHCVNADAGDNFTFGNVVGINTVNIATDSGMALSVADGAVVTLNGTTTITGDVGVGTNSTLKVLGAATITSQEALFLGGTLDMHETGTVAYNILSVRDLTGSGIAFAAQNNPKLVIDAWIGKDENVKYDSIAVTGKAKGKVIVDLSNVTVSEYSYDGTRTIKVFKPEHYINGDKSKMYNVDLSELVLDTQNKAVVLADYPAALMHVYFFEQDSSNKGNLRVIEGHGILADLAAVVQNKVCGIEMMLKIKYYPMGGVTSFNLAGDYTVYKDLGTLTRVDANIPRELTIHGNGHELKGNGKIGIAVSSNDTLTLKNFSKVSGFANYAVSNMGTTNIVDSTISSTISNGSILNTSGTVNLNGNVKNVVAPIGQKEYQGTLNNSGTLNLGSITMENTIIGTGTLEVKGNVTLKGQTITQSVINMFIRDTSVTNVTELKGNATDSLIMIANGTLRSRAGSSMKVYGGYSADATVSNNEITLEGGLVDGAAEAGCGAYIYAGYSAAGDVKGNDLTIKGAFVSKVRGIYGGFSGNENTNTTGSILNNTINIVGGTITGSTSEVDGNAGLKIAAAQNYQSSSGYTVGAPIDGNKVVISGGEIRNVMEVYGGLSFADNVVTNNAVTISGGSISCFNAAGMKIRGGQASGSRAANNQVNITGGVLTGVKSIVSGYGVSANTFASNNVVTVAGGSITGVNAGMTLRGGNGYGNVLGNKVEITGGTLAKVDRILGGFGDLTISNNVVSISGGTINLGDGNDMYMTICGGEGTSSATVSDNSVVITGGTFSSTKLQSVFGGYYHGGDNATTGNSVTINGNVIVGAGGADTSISVAGGYSFGTGAVNNNTVTIAGGTYKKAIYGGYSKDGEATGNTVNISGGTFNGDVYAAYTKTTSTGNILNWSGGTINGSVIKANAVNIAGTNANYYGKSGTVSGAVNLSGSINVGSGISSEKSSLLFYNEVTGESQSKLNIRTDSTVTLRGTTNSVGSLSFTNDDSHAGTLDMHGGKINTLAATTFGGRVNLIIDVDMSTKTADKLQVGTFDGQCTNSINLKDINITKDIAEAGTGANAITYVSNHAGTGVVTTGGTYTINGSATGKIEKKGVATNNFTYTFTKGTTDGTLNYTAVKNAAPAPTPKLMMAAATPTLALAAPQTTLLKAVEPDTTFERFIKGELEDIPETLCLTEDMNDATADMGVETQTNNTLNIYVNGHTLGTAVGNTVNVGNKNMTINGGTEKKGTVYTNWTVAEDGVLTTSGILNMQGTLTGDGRLANSGTLDITADNLGLHTLSNGTVNLGAGTLNKVVAGGTLNIVGDVTADATNIAGWTNVLAENKTLTLTGGTLGSEISGAGKVVVAGNVTTNADKLCQIGGLEVRDTLVLTGGQMEVGGLTQTEGSEVIIPATGIGADTNDVSKAIFAGIDDASKFDVSGGDLTLTGKVKEGKYYVLVAGKEVDADFVNNKLWKTENIAVTDAMMAEFEYDINTNDNSAAAKAAKVVSFEEGNTSGLAAVQQGNITMVKEFTGEIENHLGLVTKPALGDKDKYDREVWASYINTKETTDGMKLGLADGDNKAKYSGTVVGVDFYSSKKAIAGLALSYTKGDIDNTRNYTFTRNKSKYYGISFYDRVTNGNTALIYDIGYLKGDNEIGQFADGREITADVKTDTYTAGVKYEASFGTAKSRVIPFASFRYLRQNNKDYTNSHDTRITTSNQNIYIPKVGLAWTGEFGMVESGWSWRPMVEAGYIWNLGDRNVNGDVFMGSQVRGVEYDTVDKSTYYAKAGMTFNRKNFSAGVSYRYLKGDAAKNNKWNINLAWKF